MYSRLGGCAICKEIVIKYESIRKQGKWREEKTRILEWTYMSFEKKKEKLMILALRDWFKW